MAKENKKKQSNNLLNSIVEGIKAKKGQDIISLDIKETGAGVCDYFVICNGNSRTQTEAIAYSVEETVRKNTGEKPWHKEGFENSEWILLDYIDIVVHIFQPEARIFYRLEKLWGDGSVVNISE
jgi:ribosome-associated protein